MVSNALNGFRNMFLNNLNNIIMYVTGLYLNWRLHEYGHLSVANLYSMDILMGIDSWRVYGYVNLYIFIAGVMTNLLLAIVGIYLIYRYGGIGGLYGFYIVFAGFSINLFSAFASIFFGTFSIDVYNEQLWKLLYIVIAAPIIAYINYDRRLGLKPSCIFWLLIITLVFSLFALALDATVWSLYNPGNPLFKSLFGGMLIMYIFDGITAPMIFLINRSVYGRGASYTHT